MPDVEVDPSQIHSIEVDPSQVQAAPTQKGFGQGLWDSTVGGLVSAVKHYGYDVPMAHQEDIKAKLQAGDHLGALKSAFKMGADMMTGNGMGQDIAKGQWDQFEKAADSLTDPQGGGMGDRISTALGHTAAGLVPIVGPAAAKFGKDLGDGLAEGHPGYALGETAGLLLPFGVSRALDYVPKTAGTGVAANLRNSAETDYAKALNPTTLANKAATKNTLAPQMAERGFLSTSLDRVKQTADAGAAEAGQKIDDYFDAKAKQGATLPSQPILKHLDDYAKNSQVVNPQTGAVIDLDPAITKSIESMKDQIKSIADPQTGEIPMENLRQIRQYYDNKLSNVKDWALDADQGSQVAAARQLPNAIRGSLNTDPALADANAEYHFNKSLSEVAGATLDRMQGQKPSLTTGIAKGIGAAVGAKGGPVSAYLTAQAAGRLAQFRQSFLWKSLSAQSKMKIADLISSGDTPAALQYANKAAITATDQSQRTDSPASAANQ